GDRLVARQRPRRGGPDDRVRFRERALCVERLRYRRGIDRLEVDVHGGRGAVLVFDLGFGERAAAFDAPVHGLEAPVEQAVLPDLPNGADLARLGGEVHRLVRVVPVAQDAQALEVRLLALDLLGRV